MDVIYSLSAAVTVRVHGLK